MKSHPGKCDGYRQTAAVFKTVEDIVNWPRIIRSVAGVELLSTGRPASPGRNNSRISSAQNNDGIGRPSSRTKAAREL
jgi:hypothetical protein